jgi:site-specific recombinase XerD
MRRWDGLMEGYLEECRIRGLAPESIRLMRRELERWGVWLKRCRPRPVLERIEPQLLVDYLAKRSTFKAKSTVYRSLSTMRGMGDYLVRQGVWSSNPLRWMKGPKITLYHRLPRKRGPTGLRYLALGRVWFAVGWLLHANTHGRAIPQLRCWPRI